MTDEKKRHYHKKWQDMSIGLRVLAVIGGIIAGAGLLALFGFIVMLLWNALMPRLFGLPEIGYWEAWGIVILSHILFGGLGHGNRVAERRRRRHLRERIHQLECEDQTEEKT
jgi:hypothetical protein